MATLSASSSSQPIVVGPASSSRLEGQAGQELIQQVKKVTESICEVETFKQWIKPWAQENQAQHRKLLNYLQTLRDEVRHNEESEFTIALLDLAEQVWLSLRDNFQARSEYLEVPDACPGSENNFMYVWSKAEHYLECEIFGNGAVEFFYRNRSTGDNWGEDTTIGYGLSTTIFDKVSLFAW